MASSVLPLTRDIEEVKSLLQELKETTTSDVEHSSVMGVVTDASLVLLQQMEDKVLSSTKITKEEMMTLQSYFSARHAEVFHRLESKLNVLHLLSESKTTITQLDITTVEEPMDYVIPIPWSHGKMSNGKVVFYWLEK